MLLLISHLYNTRGAANFSKRTLETMQESTGTMMLEAGRGDSGKSEEENRCV